MNLDHAKLRIQNYLKSSKSWPLVVDLQTRNDLSELIDYFKIGNNQFPSIEDFCNEDGVLKLDEFYAALSHNEGNSFISCLTGFLKLQGEIQLKNALKTLMTTHISGHVVIFTYQCKNYLRFSDPRISESGRFIIVDGTPDNVPDICFIPPILNEAFPNSYQGIQKIGYVMEHCAEYNACISTNVTKSAFSESVFKITQMNNGYDYLCEKDSRTRNVPKNFGTISQWNYVLQQMGSNGNWHTLIEDHFGPERNISHPISRYSNFDENEKWLYYIALSICEITDNEYLKMAVSHAYGVDEFVKSIFRTILTVDVHNENFLSLYHQRKEIIRFFNNNLTEIIDYCKIISVKGKEAIYYLTDVSQVEKERVFTWLDTYGETFDTKGLIGIFEVVYPDLADYLSKFRFKEKLLDSYFEAYKYQKIINRILPSFEAIVDEQSVKRDFVSVLKPRSSIVDKLDTINSKVFFVDALGVEYLGYIQEKCHDYGLSVNILPTRCNLPSITFFNKEFVDTLTKKGCVISNIKDLDEIKHHGEDNFDYEKEKLPIYLIRELEIIDELLKKIRANVFGEQYEKAIIISDHGASRLAVLHNTENIWSMATTGEHSGRCCKVSEIDSKPDFAIPESDFWVLANYDRFKGGRRANVEVHGGASLEEVAVPIIEITRKRNDIEAFIADESKIVSLGAQEHAVIKIFVGIKSNNISIKLDGEYYDASETNDAYVYCVDLEKYTKRGTYTFDILNCNDVLACGQQFEIEKKGYKVNNLFD